MEGDPPGVSEGPARWEGWTELDRSQLQGEVGVGREGCRIFVGTASDRRLPEWMGGSTINPHRVSLTQRHCQCGGTVLLSQLLGMDDSRMVWPDHVVGDRLVGRSSTGGSGHCRDEVSS